MANYTPTTALQVRQGAQGPLQPGVSRTATTTHHRGECFPFSYGNTETKNKQIFRSSKVRGRYAHKLSRKLRKLPALSKSSSQSGIRRSVFVCSFNDKEDVIATENTVTNAAPPQRRINANLNLRLDAFYSQQERKIPSSCNAQIPNLHRLHPMRKAALPVVRRSEQMRRSTKQQGRNHLVYIPLF